ncbi:type II toxin-antitoxin system VapC family toxin [Candidatus Curtissbacteria bacterium]|nr:type II toxin-antitoxin system VapC family toxin [Candidatus Curtissbacteria bacterium]
MINSITVADTDALIALVLEKDPNHIKAVEISRVLTEKGITVVFPVTVFPEAITSLKRAANQPEKAHLINKQLRQGSFHVDYLDENTLLRASEIFDQASSKQNTLFDAIVAATAEKLGADSIFSFDAWYPKLGFKSAE